MIKDICQTKVTTVNTGQTIFEAAMTMKQEHVGDVVVLSSETRKPVGILTDRDIVNAVVAEKLSPEKLNVEDVMIHDLRSVSEKEGIYQATMLMKDYGVRRLPIINDKGELVGICTLDDLHVLLADELNQLAQIPRGQMQLEKEHRVRSLKLSLDNQPRNLQ